jgi:hypothetical protein
MSNKIFQWLLIASAMGFASCEKEVDLKIPPHTSKLSVTSFSAVDNGNTISVQVGRSLSITEVRNHTPFQLVAANVDLYVNGAFSQKLPYDSASGAYISTIEAESGKQYMLKVSAPGYESVEASVSAPSLVRIDSLTTIPNARKDESGEWQDAYIIKFTDPPTTGDYYIIKVLPDQDSSGGTYNSYFCLYSADGSAESVSNDPVGTNTCLDNDGLFMRDALFNGTQKEIKIYRTIYANGPAPYTPYHIELWHVPESYFRYYKSFKLAWNSNGDPFSEPINVYSNVTNGYGIFTALSIDSKEIKY